LIGSAGAMVLARQTSAKGSIKNDTLPDWAPEGTEIGYVDVVGGRLRYLVCGRGETLVLLHKLGGRIEEWRRVLPTLAEHYRVIAFDLAGHGQSEMYGPPPFLVSPETLAAQVMTALDTLALPSPYRLVANSLGGCVALITAAFWPARVAAVVSLGSALGSGTSRDAIRAISAGAVAAGQFDAEDNPMPRPMSYARKAFGLQDASIAEEQNESRAQAGRWIATTSRGVSAFDFLTLLPRISAPVLLAWGERGHYGKYVDAALAKLASGEKKLIANSGAFPHEETPETTSNVILSFLNDSENQAA